MLHAKFQDQNFEFLQSHESGVFVSISRPATNLLKLNIVLLVGLLYTHGL